MNSDPYNLTGTLSPEDRKGSIAEFAKKIIKNSNRLHSPEEFLVKDSVKPLEIKDAITFLEDAAETMRERGKTYDSEEGERSAAKVASAFNAITEKDLDASDIWLIMLLLKQVRQWSREEYHADSALDAVAYAALLAEELANA